MWMVCSGSLATEGRRGVIAASGDRRVKCGEPGLSVGRREAATREAGDDRGASLLEAVGWGSLGLSLGKREGRLVMGGEGTCLVT